MFLAIFSVLASLVYCSALQCGSCTNVTDPNACDVTVTCNTGDRCFTRSYGAGRETKFDLGCISEKECLGSTTSLDGRSVGVWNECCTTNFCNVNLCSRRSQDTSISRVAFTVTYPNGNLIDGQRPHFGMPITNIGGGYDLDAAKFTCPVAGLYFFTFSIKSKDKSSINCFIQKNGFNTVRALTAYENSYDTASVSTYLELSLGDIVNLGSCGSWQHIFVDTSTSFSGALVGY